ncbi:hypothetical protein NPIL_329631 [Nephila pilipes]|uniref:Uncharacterized protein n=1 Tax=Nephila pilipes TaxID=299642 RepID=A0A8X6TRC5_NEPPI|nr:hypothetical protein NPIL_329631 [Nephila pilipes]
MPSATVEGICQTERPKCFRSKGPAVWLELRIYSPTIKTVVSLIRSNHSDEKHLPLKFEVRLDPNEDYPSLTDAEIEALVTKGDAAVEDIAM